MIELSGYSESEFYKINIKNLFPDSNFEINIFNVINKMSAGKSKHSKFEYKLKKKNDLIENLKFRENENILEVIAASKKAGQVLVGFAAESSKSIENASEKIKKGTVQ